MRVSANRPRRAALALAVALLCLLSRPAFSDKPAFGISGEAVGPALSLQDADLLVRYRVRVTVSAEACTDPQSGRVSLRLDITAGAMAPQARAILYVDTSGGSATPKAGRIFRFSGETFGESRFVDNLFADWVPGAVCARDLIVEFVRSGRGSLQVQWSARAEFGSGTKPPPEATVQVEFIKETP